MMNAGALGALIKTKLLANAATGAQDNAALTAFANEIAAAVVEHITANAIVKPDTFTAGGISLVGTGKIE